MRSPRHGQKICISFWRVEGTNSEANAAALHNALNQAFPGSGLTSDLAAPTTRTLEAGELLCDIGEPGSTAWVIVRGRIQVITDLSSGKEHLIGIHGPGDLIGESALLDKGVRRGRLWATRRTIVAVLDRPG